MFKDDGHWAQFPSTWVNPEKSLENKTSGRCLKRVRIDVRAHARAFMMREVMELTAEEVCQELAITPTNCGYAAPRATEPARMPRNQVVWQPEKIEPRCYRVQGSERAVVPAQDGGSAGGSGSASRCHLLLCDGWPIFAGNRLDQGDDKALPRR